MEGVALKTTKSTDIFLCIIRAYFCLEYRKKINDYT